MFLTKFASLFLQKVSFVCLSGNFLQVSVFVSSSPVTRNYFLDTLDRDHVLFAPFKISTSRKASSQARLHPPECHWNAGGHLKI